MLTTEEIQKIVEKTFDLNEFMRTPPELYDPISYILSLGGKRIRPVLLLMACDMFGGDVQEAIPAATAIEIFHNFSLVHDDIMDHAPMRRGSTTVHEKWDSNTAILSGDTMLVLAYDQLLKLKNKFLRDILAAFNQTAREVCEGQQFDMNFETDEKVSIDDYLMMIRLKTAVLLGASLKIGTIIAGSSPNNIDNMYHFGIHTGMVFQLKDDLLDSYGDEKTFGKMQYSDILANKKTYLFLKALELADEQDKEMLKHYYSGIPFPVEEKVRAVMNLYNKLSIRDETHKLIEEHYSHAIQYLDKIELSEEGKANLAEFTHKLMDRDY